MGTCHSWGYRLYFCCCVCSVYVCACVGVGVRMYVLWCLTRYIILHLKHAFTCTDAVCQYMYYRNLICFYRPVYGLIFLFKWLPGDHNNQGSLVMDSRRTEIFFAKQVETVLLSWLLSYCVVSCDCRWSLTLVLHKPSSVYSWIVNTVTLN